jgi:acetyl esterase/lipase
MKILITFFLATISALALCNPNNTGAGSCPALCPATPGSTTPATIPGSGWTQFSPIDGTSVTTSGIQCILQYQFNSSTCPMTSSGSSAEGCFITFYWPVGITNTQGVYAIHGGGFIGGTADGIFGSPNGSTDTTMPVILIQKHLADLNSVGTRGYSIATVSYTLAASSTATSWPHQYQDTKCGMWYILRNQSLFPANWNSPAVYGPSAGGTLAMYVAAMPDNMYSSNCSVASIRPVGNYILVAAWPVTGFMTPFAASNWEMSYQAATVQSAFQGLGNCTSQATCRIALGGTDPYLQITQANYSYLNIPTLYQTGDVCFNSSSTACDSLARNYWSNSGIGGNLPQVFLAYAALSPPINVASIVYPGQAHEGDLGVITSQSLADAFAFFGGRNPEPMQLIATVASITPTLTAKLSIDADADFYRRKTKTGRNITRI